MHMKNLDGNDNMEEQTDKDIQAIAKIISLTRTNKIEWSSVDSKSIPRKGSEDIIDSAYVSQYKEKIIRLYRRKYKGHSITSKIGVLAFGASVKQSEMRWYSEVILDITNRNGTSLWEFPKEDILNDLLKTIKYKTSGAEDLIEGLLNE